MEIETNVATVVGVIMTDPVLHHTIRGNCYYEVKVNSERLSGSQDEISIVFSKEILQMYKDNWEVGKFIRAKGEYKSHNKRKWKNRGNRLLLYVEAKEIEFLEFEESNENKLEIMGTVCRQPIYRKTPKGRRITDLMVAVESLDKSSSYIPCVVWGNSAQIASTYEIGDHVYIKGRIQSRDYTKKLGNGEIVHRIAYEISVSKIDSLEI